MKYKLIAIDLDGTLLQDDDTISERNARVLKRLSDAGVHVVLCSGRTEKAMMRYYEQLNLNTPLISENGGRITSGKKLIYSQMLCRKILSTIVEMVQSVGEELYFQFMHDDVLIANRFEYTTLSCDKYNRHAKPCHRIDVRICNNPVEYISTHQVETHKISIISETSGLLCLLKGKLETIPGIELTSSESINVDIMKCGVTKGEGLRILTEQLGISLDECIAIGNNDNDISMIEVAGMGVAMKNGTDLLKRKADVITTYDNQTDGVADILEKYCIFENRQ